MRNNNIKETIKRMIVGRYEELNESERIQWVIDQLKKVPARKRILDAGAGELRFKKYCEHLEYVSQDFGEYDGGGIDGLHTGSWDTSECDIICDIINIPVEDASFDVVLCSEVIEHIPHPELAIKEFSRILKKNGVLILTAPFCSFTHFAPYHYCTGFNKFWYETILDEYDLKLVSCTNRGNYYLFLYQEINRLMSMKVIRRDIRTIIGGRMLKAVLRSKNRKNIDKHADLACFGYHIIAKKS